MRNNFQIAWCSFVFKKAGRSKLRRIFQYCRYPLGRFLYTQVDACYFVLTWGSAYRGVILYLILLYYDDEGTELILRMLRKYRYSSCDLYLEASYAGGSFFPFSTANETPLSI